MHTSEDILGMFRDSGALLEGHFLLTSGRHSDRYIQCARVMIRPDYTQRLAADIADVFRNDGIDLVIGPALGGIILAYEVARQLGVPGLFTERTDGVMSLRRGLSISPGQRVLVVEDVITTGGSIREVMEVVRAQGGHVAGVAALVDRSNGAVDFGVKQHALLVLDVQSWDVRDCALCRDGKTQAVKPGSRT